MTVVDLVRQHRRSYFESYWEHLYLLGIISTYFIQSILFKLVAYVLNPIFHITLYSFYLSVFLVSQINMWTPIYHMFGSSCLNHLDRGS